MDQSKGTVFSSAANSISFVDSVVVLFVLLLASCYAFLLRTQ